jgi:hypothetical protein
MKDHSGNLIEPSRRGFAKSAAAALIATPLAAALAGCRQQAPNQENASTNAAHTPTPTPSGPYAVSCEGQIVTVTHEPPIIIGSGSCYVEMGDTLTLTNVTGPPPFVYRKAGTDPYTGIHSIRIITEYKPDPTQPNKPHLTDITYVPNQTCELWIWLQKLTPGLSPDCTFDTTTLSGDPDVRLGCGGTVIDMQVTLRNDRFQPVEPTHKCGQSNRYSHMGTGLTPHFRIGQWRIVDASGRPINFPPVGPGESNGEDSYRFYVAFDHP